MSKVDITNPTMQDMITIIAIAFLFIGTATVFPAGFLTAAIYIDAVFLILGYYGIQGVYQYIKYVKYTKQYDLFPGIISDKFIIGFSAVFSVGWLALNFIIDMNWYISFVLWVLGSLGLLWLSSRSK